MSDAPKPVRMEDLANALSAVVGSSVAIVPAEALAEIRAALRPFAAFHHSSAPDEHVITQGSAIAKRQLTMGDCRRAAEALENIKETANG